MTEKQKPCCARIAYQLRSERAEMSRLANKAARASELGRSPQKFLDEIEKAKANIVLVEGNIVDHEANHASELEGEVA